MSETPSRILPAYVEPGSLRGRLVRLCVVVALLSTGLCLIAAHQTLRATLATSEDHAREEAFVAVRADITQARNDLAATLGDYAQWDEMYAQMPDPEPAWAAANMAPASGAGQLLAVLVAEHGPERFTRYRQGNVLGQGASSEDPAPETALRTLLEVSRLTPGRQHGIAALAGHPAIYAVGPVLKTDGSGPPHGRLLALAYLDRARLDRFNLPGWTLELDEAEAPQPGTLSIAGTDGAIRLVLKRLPGRASDGGQALFLVLIASGLMAVLLAAALGTVLAWLWMEPLRLIAAAATARARDRTFRLPEASRLPLIEAQAIAIGLQSLVAAEERSRAELALALERAELANRVHRRFLAQFGHEFNEPLRRLIAASDQLLLGRLSSEQAADTRRSALELESRLQDVLGLVGPAEVTTTLTVDLAGYLRDVVALVAPRAQAAGATIEITAKAQPVLLDAALLTPVLVNLLSNALTAAPGGRITVTASTSSTSSTTAADGLTVEVCDNGHGIDPLRCAEISTALQAGSLAAGDERIGLGLALCLANLRAMEGRLQIVSSNANLGTVMRVWVPKSGR